MSSQVNQKKQAYDTAQKLGEAIEVMGSTPGWREYFIPKIEEKRKAAQEVLNGKGVDEREADHARGVIEIADYVLNYYMEKRKQALAIMRKNTAAKLT